MSGLTASKQWSALDAHYAEIRQHQMRDLFDQDPQRFEHFSLRLNDILYDYSKHRITETTVKLLLALAEKAQLAEWTERLFNGDLINHTEKRAALHTALRARDAVKVILDGIDVVEEARAERLRVYRLAEAIRSQTWRGVTGRPITDVVNIGIGGSHLGPLMVSEALKPYTLRELNFHFVSNVDENDITDTLESLDPETTFFIVSSKTFTTQETMINAETARDWYLQQVGPDQPVERHFAAVTANPGLASAFGIADDNIFKIWDWVGGRYSLWSAIGLAIVIAIGPAQFDQLLDGAHEADVHFRKSPPERNIPVIMALLGIWYNNFFNAQSMVVLPYDQHLQHFPAYLQQADMESNGKSVDRDGQHVDYSTGPVLFGEIGISAQHAFYQLLHQGSKLVPADILAPIHNHRSIQHHHQALMSNVFAQTEALMRGKTAQEARREMGAQGLPPAEIERLLPYRVFPGNRPTSTLLFKTLDPRTLGSLIALYEHKIFVQGVIWNINSFDQWGVELGKQLASTILSELDSEAIADTHDSSTNGLINYYKQNRPPDTPRS